VGVIHGDKWTSVDGYAVLKWIEGPSVECTACFLCLGRYARRMSAAELSLTPVSSVAIACEWVRRYYAYEGLPFNATVERAVSQLLESSRFGWFFELTSGKETVGYAVLTRAFDHEFGGEFGILTDFFLLELYRRKGHGSRALELLEEFGRSQGFRSLDLYVLNRNAAVCEFYARRGFREFADRRPMTKSLSSGNPAGT
jgi:GNAT superfamily N-acetyltransferase